MAREPRFMESMQEKFDADAPFLSCPSRIVKDVATSLTEPILPLRRMGTIISRFHALKAGEKRRYVALHRSRIGTAQERALVARITTSFEFQDAGFRVAAGVAARIRGFG
jgi:hypothetical protein